MTVQPPLFLPGWDVEPCDTAPPEPRAVETRSSHGLDHPDSRPRIIPGDHGQPPGRRRELEPRTIHNVRAKGGLL